MSDKLQGFMHELKIGDPIYHRNLTIFPVFVPPSPGPGYMLLSEALSVESYALDAIEAPSGGPSAAIQKDQGLDFLAQMKGARCEDRPGVGLGTDIRIEASGVSGFSLTLGEHVLHLAVFNDGNEQDERNSPGFSRMSFRRGFRR